MRPDVAAAFDRLRPRPRAAAGRAADQLGLSLRRRAGGAVRGQSGSALGGAARHLAAPLRDRARPRSRRPRTPGSRPTRRGSASSSATRGSHGTSATIADRRRARRPATRRRRLGGERGRGRRGGGDGAAGVRPGPLPRRSLARAASRWNVSASLLAAQLMAESNFNPFAVSPGGRPGDRPVHAGHGGGLRPRRPVRLRRGDRRPGAPDVGPARASSTARSRSRSPPTTPGPAPVAACSCVPRLPRDPGLRRPHPRR